MGGGERADYKFFVWGSTPTGSFKVFTTFLTINRYWAKCAVSKKSGIVLIADAALPNENVVAYNMVERLRDPSHTRALSFDEFDQTMRKSGLNNLRRGSYKVEMELEKQLKASFPELGDDEKIRDIFKKDIGNNLLGMDAHWAGDEIHFAYPISIYVGEK